MLGRILEKFTEERQRRMIFWEVPRRAAEMAANTPKKFTWMPGKTLLKSSKNLKRSCAFSGLCLPCENLGVAFGNGAAEQLPAGCFLTSSNILPALSDHAAQRSGKKHTPQKWSLDTSVSTVAADALQIDSQPWLTGSLETCLLAYRRAICLLAPCCARNRHSW